jgi:hypothetical protein
VKAELQMMVQESAFNVVVIHPKSELMNLPRFPRSGVGSKAAAETASSQIPMPVDLG